MQAVIDDARKLNPEGLGVNGSPRPSSAGVALAGNAIIAGRITLAPLHPGTAGEALALACSDADGALPAALDLISAAAVTRAAPPGPALSYYRGAGGQVHAFPAGQLSPAMRYQVDHGILTALSEEDKARYLAGEF